MPASADPVAAQLIRNGQLGGIAESPPAGQRAGNPPCTSTMSGGVGSGGGGGGRGGGHPMQDRDQWSQHPPNRAPPLRGVEGGRFTSCRMDQCCAAYVTAAQVLIVVRHWNGTASHTGRIHTLLVLAASALLLLAATAGSRFFMRHRLWLLPCLRALIYAVPSVRSVGVGSALLLERPPLPGFWGAAADLARWGTGVRVGMIGIQGVVMLLPPGATLATQAVLVLLALNSQGYCTTQLLHHPLSQRRMATVAAAMECAALPLVAMQPLAGSVESAAAIMSGHAPVDVVCHATLSFSHVLVGLLLPNLVSVYWWRPQPGNAADNNIIGAAAAAGPARRASWRSRLLTWLQLAAAGVDWAVYCVVRPWASPLVRGLVCWWLVAYAWLCCRLAAGQP